MNDAAEKVLNELRNNKEQEVFIDPATITIICAILGALFQAIRLYCDWKKNKKAGENISGHLQRKSFLARRTIKRYVKENMTPEDYAVRGEAVINAILEAGSKATPEYISELLNNGVYYEA